MAGTLARPGSQIALLYPLCPRDIVDALHLEQAVAPCGRNVAADTDGACLDAVPFARFGATSGHRLGHGMPFRTQRIICATTAAAIRSERRAYR